MKDFYAILDIPPDASPEDIKSAYRNLVHLHHPDRNPLDANATERFLELKEAYETLSDEEARAAYDREFVANFPGYELEDFAVEFPIWERNPPKEMPVVHDDGTNTLLKIFMVLLMPILAGGLVMHFTGNVTGMLIASVAGLVAAIWIGQAMGS